MPDGCIVDVSPRLRLPLPSLVSRAESRVGRMCYAREDLPLDAAGAQRLRVLLPGARPAGLAGMEPESVGHADGLRLGFADGSWAMLRPSRGLPRARAYAEAPTPAAADALLEAAAGLARSLAPSGPVV